MGPQYHVLVKVASIEEARWVVLLSDVVVYVIFACRGDQSDDLVDFIAVKRLAAQVVYANLPPMPYIPS